MTNDLSALLPFFLVFAVLAVAGSLVSIALLGRTVARHHRHHRLRVARHQSIPAYYRRLVLGH